MKSRLVCLFVLVGVGFAAVAGAGTLEENKAVVAKFIAAGNAKDFENLPSFLTEDFTRHSQASPSARIESRDQFVLHMRDDLETFPDSRIEVRQVIAEGDRVAVWGSYLGTYQGDGADGEIVGRRIDVEFAAIFRLDGGGLIDEMWATWDNAAVRRQLTFRGRK